MDPKFEIGIFFVIFCCLSSFFFARVFLHQWRLLKGSDGS